MQAFPRILPTFFIAIFLTGCIGDDDNEFEESEQIFPSEVTFQFIEADVTKEESRISEVSFYSRDVIFVNDHRVTFRDGTSFTNEAYYVTNLYSTLFCLETYAEYDPVFGEGLSGSCPQRDYSNGDRPTPQGNGELIYRLKPVDIDDYRFPLSLSLTTKTSLWNYLTSTAEISMLPEITSPGTNSDTNNTVQLYWNLPPESQSVSLAYAGCNATDKYFENLTFNQLSFIEMDALSEEYEVELSDLTTDTIPDGCEVTFWVVSEIQGTISSDFAGGDFVLNLISDPVSVIYRQ